MIKRIMKSATAVKLVPLSLVAAGAIFCYHNSARADLSTSLHNFADSVTYPWANGQPCSPCHIAHSQQPQTNGPLWNHNQPAGPFTPYSSGTMNAAPGPPTGISKSCLGCHDGITGMDAYGGSAGVPTLMTGTAVLGTNLSQSHPLSFNYTDALATADGELNPPTTTNVPALGGTIYDKMLFGPAAPAAHAMECASCHDVHNSANIAKMLVMANNFDQMCTTCHNK